MAEKTILRSLIKKYFPPDLLVKLELVSNAHDVDNNEKTDEVLELLNEYHVPFSSLGNGTNRYGILVDGYAVKIALDRAGRIDNMREFKYSRVHYPDVVKVYECCTNGMVATFEYVTIFSLDDFYDNQNKMREILERLTTNFLVGDIGISTNNYINWGTRSDGSIVILDFAYIYSLSYRGFLCTCEDEGVLQFDHDFNYLQCPFCKKKYQFSDIRKRITKQDEINEIGDIRECGYVLTEANQEFILDPNKSEYLKPKKKKNKDHEKIKKKDDRDDEEFTYKDQMKIMNSLLNINGRNHNV